MILALTEQQIDVLAPDASSVKSARGLTNVVKWPLLGANKDAIWGHCQGSGSTPYQTAIDLGAMAFKCSCPSRKFPCKHALALMYLASKQTSAFTQGEAPDWVHTWLDKRQQSAQKQQERQERKNTEKPVNERAQAKRKEQRHTRILDGIDDLQRWLKDIVRAGLIHLPQPLAPVVDTLARRTIDAQAPGLAVALQGIASMSLSREGWERRLLEELTRIYLLTESYKHLERLEPIWQAEVRSLIGLPQSKEEVMQAGAILDDWQILYKVREEQDKLIRTTVWMQGYNTKRMAVYTDYKPSNQFISSENTLLQGSVYSGEMYFYAGILGMRAFPGELSLKSTVSSPHAHKSLREAEQSYRSAMAQNPFLRSYPLLLEEVYLMREGEEWGLRDTEGTFVPVHYNEITVASCLSLFGGSAMKVFVLLSRERWQIAATWLGDSYNSWVIALDDE